MDCNVTAPCSDFSVTLEVPDFSQRADSAWDNYCAPTPAADVVYYWGQTYASLLNGQPWPPPRVPADLGASQMVETLVTLMNTSLQDGTTVPNWVVGLDRYLEKNDGDESVVWQVQLVTPGPPYSLPASQAPSWIGSSTSSASARWS